MIQVFGNCFHVREQLKQLGCEWDADVKIWLAPDAVHPQAQQLADVENRREWVEYLGTLAWCQGQYTETVWLASLRAASLRIPYQEAWNEIAGRVRAQKRTSDHWFDRNIGRAYSSVLEQPVVSRLEGKRQKTEKPVFQNDVLESVARGAGGVGIRFLAERSPIDPRDCSPHDFLSALYDPGERVVIFEKFESQGQWLWSEEMGFVSTVISPAALYERAQEPFEQPGKVFDASGPDGVWYLCNPVLGEWKWMEEVASSDDPHWSRRFQDCVTAWRYMVLESDKARARDWVAMAVQLPLRIAAIYTSGGKSVHVLIRLDAKTKAQWDEWKDEIKPIVVRLGADAGCMSAVRLTRLPGCLRGQKQQKLLYLNPAPDMTPIEAQKRVREILTEDGK